MKLRSGKSLAFKFATFSVLAVVVPAFAVAVSLILVGRRALTESIYVQQSETAQRIANRISMHVENVRSLLSIASKEPGLAVLPRIRQEESLRRLLRWQPTFKEAILVNAQGREIAKLTSKGNRFISGPLASRKGRPEVLSAIGQGKAVVSEAFLAGDRLPYLFVSCPAYGKRAVLIVKVSLENLWDLVKRAAEGRDAIAYVIDRQGRLLAHPDPSRVQAHTDMGNISIVRAFLEGRIGRKSFGLERNAQNEEVVSVLQEVPDLHWGVVVEMPAAKAYAPIREMEIEVLKWTALSILVILIFALWRVREILKPIRLLEEGARKISQGQLDVDLPIRTGDELERLAESFKQMAGSLKHLDELRRDLISMIIHDLKSPLSAIMGGIDYLLGAESGNLSESSRRVLALSRRSSDDLLTMIQNLLDVAKMEEGKFSPNLEELNLQELLEECGERFRLQIEREGKRLVKDFSPRIPRVFADGQLIRRVASNLLSNAIRHTSSKGTITLAARRAETELQVRVEDDGEGISPEYREKIFDKFVQAERQRVRFRSGTGLGLTFCKMAVELHGGRIRVESEPGKGSSFIFTLPAPSAGAEKLKNR